MYYFLLLNSSLLSAENKFFSIILFGSIAYIITHAIIYYTPLKLLEIFRNYYWVIFALDIFTTSYKIYYNPLLIENISTNITSTTNETINMKNSLQQIQSKLGDMLSGVNKPLTITDNTLISQQQPSVKINKTPIIHSMYDNKSSQIIEPNNIISTSTSTSTSTPISEIKNKSSQNNLYDEMEMFNRSFISNIGNISTKMPDIIQQMPSPNINTNVSIDIPDNVSVAGSDIGTFDMTEFANNI